MIVTCNLRLTPINYRKLAAPIRRGLGGQGRGNGKRGIHKLRNGPSPIGHANGLRWRRAQGFMNPAEIVVRNIQRDPAPSDSILTSSAVEDRETKAIAEYGQLFRPGEPCE